MFDPLQVYNISAQSSSDGYENLDEEHFAQRYGHVATLGRPLVGQVLYGVGKLLIRVGQKLASENTSIELSKDTA